MRIAQVAPLFESVPPVAYGGTERIVSYLTEELVRLGHEVTLFATGDSVTSARLVPICPMGLRLDPNCVDRYAHIVVLVETVFSQIDSFDVVHFHIDYFHFPLLRRRWMPNLTTLHGRLDIPDLVPLYRTYCEMPVVSISHAQRKPLSWLNWLGTVYHGLPEDLYRPEFSCGEYLAFLGRISPEKGVDRAIEIARRAGMPLKIAAKVDPADREYYQQKIRPLLREPMVEFLGEIGQKDKNEFLGKAYALLFPIDWPEPFGLVMIEAMACGTPVIAFRRGSVPEVMEDGVTGWIVEDVEGAVKAVAKVDRISRVECRRVFERRFTAERMALDYLNLYQRVTQALESRDGLGPVGPVKVKVAA
ncbi:glycosyltransferase family 4 protein [Candidatus Methylacidithermus pantelleriae]|uniref:N-acetyl-alpha-D-glucosaminyl L-malate synthase n=1 Tax=Candidatus Methylacidithermus pantelleriae TaxID=2744239 RepID=A0A8J2BN02_9BACT|nr:glycosyltransferase family 4 protein [Candidatus Methylacidithermus pantelleriae]CAF0691916.1 N-acetyl-alpha-D-glucosaminyl L-malate synthase [Candidatus Methylacidithermus pantelleriae]